MKKELAYAFALDASDPLASYRQEFIIPEKDGQHQVYFLGNSLGLQPKKTAYFLNEVLDQWARYGVEGFFMGEDPWLNYHDHLVKPLAAIVGALPSELVVMNQLTVNLHLMMVSFYRPAGKRKKIICEAKAFPSDQYMFETHLKALGYNPDEVLVEVGPRAGEACIRQQDIVAAIHETGDELALVLWGGVNYYTGQVFDLEAITTAGHNAGAKVGFDLAHAAGNIPLNLHAWNVDFACWCSYKYLNSGPGAIGAAFIHERYHREDALYRFAGWWGYEKETRFKMEKGFRPVQSAEGWQLSTPSPLLYAAHRASLEIFSRAGFENCVKKSRQMAAYLRYLLEDLQQDQPGKFELLTPSDPAQRGCQVSLLIHTGGRALFEQLTEQGIFADWREPDVIRVAPVPLYNRYQEIWHFVQELGR
ncbi:kynureninase [Flavihumibacter sp. CACIAM 22H1]|uniref:kynureninase n=1 Tax=Flavihumibacter sp. CACIAM 22H1 TaxID=1812911 RepID=UPI0007A81C95|nr:kynureninase [Flavihumibacter sp. CACIAM 22H1]KYP14867.1 MAG: kynureninase [Flavihumibacter sp. CACIAM 22H1]